MNTEVKKWTIDGAGKPIKREKRQCCPTLWVQVKFTVTGIQHELEEIGEHLSTKVLTTMRDGDASIIDATRIWIPSVWSFPGFDWGIALDLWIWSDRCLCGRCNVVAFPRCADKGTSGPGFQYLCRPEMVKLVERGLQWGGAKIDMLLVMWLEWLLIWCVQSCAARCYASSGVIDYVTCYVDTNYVGCIARAISKKSSELLIELGHMAAKVAVKGLNSFIVFDSWWVCRWTNQYTNLVTIVWLWRS